MRLTTTIPAAGIQKAVKITGRSLIVENSGVYSSVEEVPTFRFNPGPINNPIYPRSVYVNSEGMFNSIILEGTEESAGDSITLFSTDECLTTDLNINLSETAEAIVGVTAEETLLDSVYSFPEIVLLNDGKLPTAVYIATSDNPIHFAFDVDPEQDPGTLFYNLQSPGPNRRNEPVKISGIDFIRSLRFINETAATASTLVYTFEY